MVPVLVFDIETVPDVAGLRRIWDLGPEVSDEAVVERIVGCSIFFRGKGAKNRIGVADIKHEKHDFKL